MYEPTRTDAIRPPRPPHHARTGQDGPPGKAVGRPAAPGVPDQAPPLSRAEHLDVQLAGHLGALLTVTEELRETAPSTELDEAARRIADRIEVLSPQGTPALIWEGSHPREDDRSEPAELHRRAHLLAGRVLVVAAARQDTATAMLACLRMDAHAEALSGATLVA